LGFNRSVVPYGYFFITVGDYPMRLTPSFGSVRFGETLKSTQPTEWAAGASGSHVTLLAGSTFEQNDNTLTPLTDSKGNRIEDIKPVTFDQQIIDGGFIQRNFEAVV